MTNKDHVFKIIKESKFTDNVKKITTSFKYLLPPIKGEFLENLIVDSLYPKIIDYKQGSIEQQRDFSLIVSSKKTLKISMKSGSIKGKNKPRLELNGSRMGSDRYKTMQDRVDYMNEKFVDGVLSCIFTEHPVESRYHKCEFRYIDPKIFGEYRERDFKKHGAIYKHVNSINDIITTMHPSMAHLVWYHIPDELLKSNTLTINF